MSDLPYGLPVTFDPSMEPGTWRLDFDTKPGAGSKFDCSGWVNEPNMPRWTWDVVLVLSAKFLFDVGHKTVAELYSIAAPWRDFAAEMFTYYEPLRAEYHINIRWRSERAKEGNLAVAPLLSRMREWQIAEAERARRDPSREDRQSA